MKQEDLCIFLENFDHIDSAVLGGSGQLYGATLCVDCKLWGPLDENGFIVDFGEIKKSAREFLHQYDHKLIIENPEGVQIKPIDTKHLQVDFELEGVQCFYSSPASAIKKITQSSESLERSLELELEQNLLEKYGKSIKIKCRIYKPYEKNFFSYTHGLSNHKGNCQRLLHGHSCLIKVNEAQQIINAMKTQNPHFASEDQIINTHGNSVELGYRSFEGQYHLKLPKKRVCIVKPTASIESIAVELFNTHSQSFELNSIMVTEGLSKGAIYPARS